MILLKKAYHVKRIVQMHFHVFEPGRTVFTQH
jgi:hypothetical protein